MIDHDDTQETAHEQSKLVITLDGAVIKEFVIDQDTISIGRKLNNDIQLSDLTVSGNHSIIQYSDHETYIKDIASTNGTLLNGVRITKSALKHGDIIQIGTYQFAFHAAQEIYQPTMFIKAEVEEIEQALKSSSSLSIEMDDIHLAGVRILNGPLESKVLELTKPFNTIGFNGEKLAIIARNPDGYTISALSDKKFKRQSDIPRINGTSIGKDFKKLHDHDIIELCDTQIEFFSYR